MIKNLIFSCLIAVLVCSCSKKEHGDNRLKPTHFDLVFGDYYGMCGGDCFDVYGLNRSSLHEDHVVERYMGNYVFKPLMRRDREDFDSVRQLMLEIPDELYLTKIRTYGSPDSHDQGGIYIGVDIGGHNARVIILDNDDTPDQSAEIIEFKNKIREAIRKLR